MEEVYYFDIYSEVRDLLNVQVTELNELLLLMITLLKFFKIVLVLAHDLIFDVPLCFFMHANKEVQLYSAQLAPHCIIKYLEAIFYFMFLRRNILHCIKYVFVRVCVGVQQLLSLAPISVYLHE